MPLWMFMKNRNNIFIDMKNTIKRILSEEADKKKDVLLKYVQRNGLIKGSKLVGGYENLKQILKGTDYLTRECMVRTIKDYFNQPTSRPYLDLNQDLDMEHIQIYDGDEHFITLNELSKKGFGYIVYELNEYEEYDEVHTANSDYDARDARGEYLLDTIHLYELVDGVMEKYEKDTSNKWN